jgi:hypothetical protein
MEAEREAITGQNLMSTFLALLSKAQSGAKLLREG